MSELERRLRATVRTHASAATDAHAPRDVKRAIARRRRLKAGSIGTAVAVVLGSVSVGGLGLSDAAESPAPTPTLSPDLSMDPGSLAYATVPLPDITQMYMGSEVQGAQWCGQAPPEPKKSEGDFVADFDVPEQLDFSLDAYTFGTQAQQARITLNYSDSDQLPAFGGGLTALLVEDGVVVGFMEEYSPTVINTFTRDQTKTYAWQWDGWINNCDDSSNGMPPPAGEYEAVFVSRVHNDLTSAAQWSLHMNNYVLPAAADLEAYREGSFYCDQRQMWGENEPLTCNPNAVVGFELDQEAQTATVPYETSYYLRDVDFTFATVPVPATVSGELPEDFYSYGMDHAYEPGTEIQCGDFYSHVEGSEVQMVGDLESWTDLPEPGTALGAALWLMRTEWETARVEAPHNPRIWLTQSKEVSEEQSSPDGSSYQATYHGYEVVGWLDTASNTADPVHIFVYDGPRDWPLTITDAQWCDGEQPSATNEAVRHFGFEGIVSEPATVTLNDDTTYDDVAIMLQSGYFG